VILIVKRIVFVAAKIEDFAEPHIGAVDGKNLRDVWEQCPRQGRSPISRKIYLLEDKGSEGGLAG